MAAISDINQFNPLKCFVEDSNWNCFKTTGWGTETKELDRILRIISSTKVQKV